MSWLGLYLKKGFSFVFRRDWPGDEKLAQPMDPSKRVTKEEIEKEIRKEQR